MSLRTSLRAYVPGWLSDRRSAGKSAGWRVLWGAAVVLDALAQATREGVFAAWPGYGTPSALSETGKSRQIVRGRAETNDSYAARLRDWRELHKARGLMFGLTREVQHYLGKTNAGQFFEVRCVNRAGVWGMRDAAGEYTFLDPGATAWPWDWDSVSHPERNDPQAPFWSDIWVIVQPEVYAPIGAWTLSTTSWGHAAPQTEVAALRGLLEDWKAGHSFVRAVIWNPNPVDLDPTLFGSVRPDGTWGSWGHDVAGVRRPSRPNTMRFWETKHA